jgi:hypothetical protein
MANRHSRTPYRRVHGRTGAADHTHWPAVGKPDRKNPAANLLTTYDRPETKHQQTPPSGGWKFCGEPGGKSAECAEDHCHTTNLGEKKSGRLRGGIYSRIVLKTPILKKVKKTGERTA